MIVFVIMVIAVAFILLFFGAIVGIGIAIARSAKKSQLKAANNHNSFVNLQLPPALREKVNSKVVEKSSPTISTQRIIKEFSNFSRSYLGHNDPNIEQKTVTMSLGGERLKLLRYIIITKESSYLALPIMEGLLELYKISGRLNIKLNDRLVAILDYASGEVRNTAGAVCGYLRIPQPAPKSPLNIEGVGSYQLEYKNTLFLNNRAACHLVPSETQLTKLSQYMASIKSNSVTTVDFFSNIDEALTNWEAQVALAIGLDLFYSSERCTLSLSADVMEERDGIFD